MLLRKILILLQIFVAVIASAQNQESLYNPKPRADFLFNYYEQDGTHSAVTGGTGTEYLIDRSARLLINVPLDSLSQLSIESGFNYYSSASTDRIDSEVSSASSRDGRGRFNIHYEKYDKKQKHALSFGGGSSIESDYISANVSAGYSLRTVNQSLFSAGINIFFDRWIIYPPEEFRSQNNVVYHTDKRRTYSAALSWSGVINKRCNYLFAVTPSIQEGLLSTPFHRVFFSNGERAIESLPSKRYRWPISTQVNYYFGKYIILRSSYNFYTDNWDLQGHTLQLETVIKLFPNLSIYPLFRWYTQSKSKFFAPVFSHNMPVFITKNNHYTSDYDLSSFNSSTGGIGINYHRAVGLFNFSGKESSRKNYFDQMEVRYVRYIRSDGLYSGAVGLSLGYTF